MVEPSLPPPSPDRFLAQPCTNTGTATIDASASAAATAIRTLSLLVMIPPSLGF